MVSLRLRGLGLGTLLKRTVKEFIDDDMLTYASALAYQMLFSLFPFLLFLIAVIGFLNVPDFFVWLRQQAAVLLPVEASIQVNDVIDELQDQQGGLLSAGIVIALWSASAGVRSTMNALNTAYDVEEGRPAWKRFLLSIVYTIGIAIMLLGAAGLMVLGPQGMIWLARQVGIEQLFVTLWTWLRWPVAVLLLMVAVAIVYYVAPNVDHTFRCITPGSVFAVMMWVIASLGFGYYVQNFANYNAIYGSIGAIIILLFYFYLSAAVLLFGAEMNAVIEHHASEGKEPDEKQFSSK